MSSLSSNNQISNSSLNQQAVQKRKTDEKESEKELASLVLMLEDVIKEVASSESLTMSSNQEYPSRINEKKFYNQHNPSSAAIISTAPANAATSSYPTTEEDVSLNSAAMTSTVPATSTSTTPTSSSYPTSQEVAGALACMSEMVSELQNQIQNSTNQSYIFSCQIMITQINAQMAAMNEYISEYNKAVNDINSYFYWAYDQTGAADVAQNAINSCNSLVIKIWQSECQACRILGLPPPPYPSSSLLTADDDFYTDPFAPYYTSMGSTVPSSDAQNAINYYMSRTTTTTDYYIGKDGNTYPVTYTVSDPDYKGLEKYIQAHCPCPITFPAGCTDPNEMLKIAGEQVQAYGCSEAQQATDNLESSLLLASSPVMRAIGQLIFSNMEFSEQAIKELEQMMNAVVNTMTLISSLGSSDYNEGPSNGLINQILSIMNNAVSELEGLIASSENASVKNDGRILEKLTQNAKNNLEKVKEKTKEIIKLIKEAEESEELSKTVGIITDVMMLVMAVMTGNVGLIVCTAIIFALDQTGYMEKLQDKIAVSIQKDMEKNGTSHEKAEKDSKAIAAAVVVGIVIAATFVSMEGTEMALSMFAEDAEVASAAEVTSAKVSTQANSEACEQEIEMTSMQKTDQVGGKTNQSPSIENISTKEKAKYMSNNLILAISTGLQQIASTNLAEYATRANQNGKKSEEEIQKEVLKNTLIVDIAAMIASIGLMSSMSELKASEFLVSSKLSKAVKETIGLQNIYNGLNIVNLGATAVQSVSELQRAMILKKQAEVEKDLGLSKANLEFIDYLQDIMNQHMQNTQQEYQNVFQSREKTDSDMLRNMLAFEAEYTKILAQSA